MNDYDSDYDDLTRALATLLLVVLLLLVARS